MKKIFLFLAFLFTLSFLFAQRPVGNDSFQLQTVGSSKTFFKSKGAIGSDSGFVVAIFPDTVSANSSKISHYPGGFIRTGNSTWLRDVTATNWIPFGSFDSTTIYNILNQKLNIIDTVGLWQAQGIYLTNFVRLTDSTVRYVFNFGDAYIDDTSRIAFTQENITNITNIFNYLDSIKGDDTTFIRGPTANGLPFAYSVNDPLSDNDTLHFYFPPNNIAGDSVLTTDVSGNLKMKLVTSGTSIDTTSLSNRINLKQNLVTLTTTGSSGASTFNQGTGALNIPQYSGGGITGSGVWGRVTYWNGPSSITSDTSFRYTPSVVVPSTGGGGNIAAFNIKPTVTATQNNDTLYGVRIKSTFSLGALTGVTYYGLGTDSDIVVNNVRIGHGKNGLVNNIVVGNGALLGINSGTGGNIAIGQQALRDNTTGSNNIAIGTAAMLNNTTGATSSIAIGSSALQVATGGTNTAVGHQSLIANTSGTFNTAIGNAAMRLNITGGSNTAIGNQSLDKTTASENTGIGDHALFSNAGGSANVAVGYNSVYSNTSGVNNIGIGRSVLNNNTTGSNNVATGYFGIWQTTSSNNTAYGSKTGYFNTSGSGNVYLGYLAGSWGGNAANSDKFYLANDTSATGTLIHGDFSTGQVQINPSAKSPTLTPSAALEVISTTRGLLPPRMTTTEKNAISSPAEGLTVYDLTLHKLYVYDGSVWQAAW